MGAGSACRFAIVAALVVALVAFAQTSRADELTSTQRDFAGRLVAAALERTKHRVVYDPAYVKIAYPGGDVAPGRGVCTDVVIRAYRALGIDLQKEVHEDMRRHFGLYPKRWGLAAPDTNIDHRRVPNLRTFFARHGKKPAVTQNPSDYLPGDLVTWNLDSGVPHIGIVTDRRGPDKKRFLIVHNIGAGPQLEDVLFAWKITGHYRYGGK